MTITMGLFAGSFGYLLGPRKGALAALLGISVYTILVDAMMHAAIPGDLSIFTRQVGRRQYTMNNLELIAGVIAFFIQLFLGGQAVLLGLVYDFI